jgi:DNA-directed RNA polymerase specialized sigma24 family protein
MTNETCSMNIACASEANLAHLAGQGHLGAFAALFDLHKATVYSHCLAATKSVPDAEQLTQEIFLSVFRNLAAGAGGADLSLRIHNAAVQRLEIHERKVRLGAAYLDQLVALASEPVVFPRAPGRFASLRVWMREALAHRFNQGSIWTKFARPRQTA